MNYTLSIQLEGADKVDSALSSLMTKIKAIGSGKMPSVSDWLGTTSSNEAAGEKVGQSVSAGIAKGFKKGGYLNPFTLAVAKAEKDLNKFWNDAVKIGSKSGPPPVQKVDWKKVLLGVGLGLSGNNFLGSRLISDQLGVGQGGGGGVAGGIFGKSGILGFSEIEAAFKIFKFAVNKFSESVDNARQIYAKSLQSGLGLGFQQKRTMLASLLGVSETDVNKFGAAIAYLNPKISYAADILAKTNLPLTTAGVEMSVLKYDLDALVAVIAADVAPAITLFIRLIEGLVKAITKVFNNQYFKWFVQAAIPGAAAIGLLNTVQKLTGANGGQIPTPQAFMKQLPASTFEHMGLMIGGGGQTTNDLIRKSNSYLQVIAKAVVGGVPRANQFNLSPLTANP